MRKTLVSMKFDQDLLDRVARYAKRHGLARTTVFTEAVERFLLEKGRDHVAMVSGRDADDPGLASAGVRGVHGGE